MFSVESSAHSRIAVLPYLRLVLVLAVAAVALLSIATKAEAVTPIETLGVAAADEVTLKAKIATINRRVSRLGSQIGNLRNQEAVTQAKLNSEIAKLTAERARYIKLKAKLKRKVELLGQRVRTIFESNDPDMISVALKSNGYSDLLTRLSFARNIARGDRSLVKEVKGLKKQSLEKKRLLKRIAIQIAAHRDQLAAARSGLEQESSTLVSVRDQSQAKLSEIQRRRAEIATEVARIRAQAPAVQQGVDMSNPADGIVSGPGNIAAPAGSPEALKRAIAAANEIARTPYKWGGGHGRVEDSGYDCSGSLSYPLIKAGLQKAPLTSSGYMNYGNPGEGDANDIKIYANSGHAYAKIGDKYYDTSSAKRSGTRWSSKNLNGTAGYAVRHVKIG